MQVRKRAKSARTYAVITADVVGSRRIAGFRKKRDSVLRGLSEAQLEQGLILSPYTVTVWDEFQAIMSSPEKFPKATVDLRRQFYPMQLRIAVWSRLRAKVLKHFATLASTSDGWNASSC